MKFFFSHGVSFDRPIIASCGSGVTARGRVVLALATLDVPDVTLYDGAMERMGRAYRFTG